MTVYFGLVKRTNKLKKASWLRSQADKKLERQYIAANQFKDPTLIPDERNKIRLGRTFPQKFYESRAVRTYDPTPLIKNGKLNRLPYTTIPDKYMNRIYSDLPGFKPIHEKIVYSQLDNLADEFL